jgi:hypothetical protein
MEMFHRVVEIGAALEVARFDGSRIQVFLQTQAQAI